MKILICILILLAVVVIVALVFLLFMVLFNDKSSKGIVEYPMTFIEECKGDCTICNDEVKSVCESVRVEEIQDDN